MSYLPSLPWLTGYDYAYHVKHVVFNVQHVLSMSNGPCRNVDMLYYNITGERERG